MSTGTARDFTQRIVVITGAAQGIGLAVARQFARRGATLALLDSQGTVNETATAIHSEYRQRAHGYVVDVSDDAAVEKTVADIEQQLGAIDILVNVAGILHMAPALDISSRDWSRSFAVNTTGVFNLCSSVARRMVIRRRGCIVTVGSNAATTPRTNMTAYAASKAATHQYMKCLGLELAPFGIRCNIVSPGSTDTDMQRQLWTTDQAPDAVIQGSLQDFRLGIPLQRIAHADDIAHAVCFLASDQACHITLHDLRVDGGATLDA